MSKAAKKRAATFNPTETAEAAEVRRKRAKKPAAKPTSRANGKHGGKTPPPEPTADLEEMKPPFECYYVSEKGRYFMLNQRGEWGSATLEEIRRELRANGINGRNLDGKLVSLQDKMLRYIQRRCSIDAAMPLAGHRAGLRTVNGLRLLVTIPPNIVEPLVGECLTIMKMFSQFCGVGVDKWGDEQFMALKLWLARAYRQIAEGKPLPGHCLVLAGPKAACKTMIQERIISTILGGRNAKAALVFVKDKDFTSDLAEAEHLYLADELVSSDYRTRMNLAEKIKSFVANRFHSVHPKGVDQMTLDPRWRITISLNDSPDRLAMLPPLDDEDIADKVVLMRCYPVERPSNDAEGEAWVERMLAEVPAFLHEILLLPVPDSLRETEGVRFGFKAFRNAGLMAEMADNETESTALAMFDKLLFWKLDGPEPIEATPHEIRTMLLDKAGDDALTLRELQRLCPNETRMGQVLARIMSRHPKRVEKPPRWGIGRKWRILPPPEDEKHSDQEGAVGTKE